MYEYKIKEVAKVVDGDTVDIIIDLGFGLTKKSGSDWLVSIRQNPEHAIWKKKN